MSHADDAESDHAREIAELRSEVGQGVVRAIAGAGTALLRVKRLRSNQVYDVEYAEGLTGGTIERLLTQALDNLVAVEALLPKDPS